MLFSKKNTSKKVIKLNFLSKWIGKYEYAWKKMVSKLNHLQPACSWAIIQILLPHPQIFFRAMLHNSRSSKAFSVPRVFVSNSMYLFLISEKQDDCSHKKIFFWPYCFFNIDRDLKHTNVSMLNGRQLRNSLSKANSLYPVHVIYKLQKSYYKTVNKQDGSFTFKKDSHWNLRNFQKQLSDSVMLITTSVFNLKIRGLFHFV